MKGKKKIFAFEIQMDEYRSKHCEFNNEKVVKKSASEELSFAYFRKCVYSINKLIIC